MVSSRPTSLIRFLPLFRQQPDYLRLTGSYALNAHFLKKTLKLRIVMAVTDRGSLVLDVSCR